MTDSTVRCGQTFFIRKNTNKVLANFAGQQIDARKNMNEDEQVYKRGASPPLQPITYPFRLPVQYQINPNWRNSSSDECSSKETRPKKNRKKKKQKKSKKAMRYEGELHLVPAASGNYSASPSPSPPPIDKEENIVKNNKLCHDYGVTGHCARAHCFDMHSEVKNMGTFKSSTHKLLTLFSIYILVSMQVLLPGTGVCRWRGM